MRRAIPSRDRPAACVPAGAASSAVRTTDAPAQTDGFPRRAARESLLVVAVGVEARGAARRPACFLRLIVLRGPGGGSAAQPLSLLDQLADLLATLVTDLRVELRSAARAHALSALLADLLVELVPAFRLDGLAALLADLLVEAGTPLQIGRASCMESWFG